MKKRPNFIASVSDTLMVNQSTENLTKKPVEEKPVAKAAELSEEKPIKDEVPPRKYKLPGRPKGVPKKQYSIYIPEEMLPQMAAPIQYYQGDISKYLIKLINDDLERNKEAYKQLMNISVM